MTGVARAAPPGALPRTPGYFSNNENQGVCS
jgi:hypothetical protein